jgi:N-acyl-D-aspartate/D-glutamate deacylase
MTAREIIAVDEEDYGHFVDTETMRPIGDRSRIKPVNAKFHLAHRRGSNQISYTTVYVYMAVSVLTVGGTILLFEYLHRMG